MSRKVRRHFTDDFKQQIVALHNAGKKRSELIREYDLTPLNLQTSQNNRLFQVS
ncbi:transposase [Streptococcus dysgalactiae]|nr:transposase [Streptococcus dysgalactiae]